MHDQPKQTAPSPLPFPSHQVLNVTRMCPSLSHDYTLHSLKHSTQVIHQVLFFAQPLYWELEFKNLAAMTPILQQLVNVIMKRISCCAGGAEGTMRAQRRCLTEPGCAGAASWQR